MSAFPAHGMECHWHPGRPVVGYCQDCHVFVCKTCADLGRVPGPTSLRHPVRCTDCQLLYVRSQIFKLRRRMQRALGMAIFTLIVTEVIFNWVAFGGGAILGGLIAAYIVGAIFLGGLAGIFTAPWLVIKDFRILDMLRRREATILRVQRHIETVGADVAPPSGEPYVEPSPEVETAPADPSIASDKAVEEEAEFDPNTPTYM